MESKAPMTTAAKLDIQRPFLEAWKRDHDAAMSCYALEDTLVVGNWLFRVLSDVDRDLQADVRSGRADPARKHEILAAYRQWFAPCDQVRSRIAELEGQNFTVKGAEEFRRNCEEAERILDQEEKLGGRIQPVVIDAEGRIFLDGGEQLIMPALEPEKILRAIQEDASGLGRPLEEIIAQRQQKQGDA